MAAADSARISANLDRVRGAIASACARAGRKPETVRLVAVTKSAGLEEVAALYNLGVRDFGESRYPACLEKVACPDLAGARWHFIGHLQRNKAGKVLERFNVIHSLDSARLAETLRAEAERLGREVEALLEVNVSGEESKYGLSPDGAAELCAALAGPRPVRISGLMTMAPQADDPEAARPVFAGLRRLRDELRGRLDLELPLLSMGMSGDYEVAIEEGATLVRVGSALFE